MQVKQPSILITGSTGFVGSRLYAEVIKQGFVVRRSVRCTYGMRSEVVVGDLGSNVDWSEAVKSIEVVVHLAARVHIMKDDSKMPLDEFRKVNTEGTLNLARQAADAGVKRFIFMSSIKVNGEMTDIDCPFTPDDSHVPTDPYGLSKYEAEQGLLGLAKLTGMDVVIIRSPLVYGPYVKGNFLSMLKWVDRSVPLPLGAIENKRSFIALDSLVDFIIHCIDHPKAANEVFLISDGEDVSTSELLRKVAKAFGRQSRLIPLPVGLMKLAAELVGKGDVANRLFSSLQVDNSKAKNLLNWRPVMSMDEQLKKTAEAYLKDEKTL